MSGWIKMGVGLRRHPKVVRMASALKADRLRVVGALHAVWCVFDEHSHDGNLTGYTPAIMDEEIGWRGFSAAMVATRWLVEDADGLTVPDYEEHNGPTAKRRALDTQSKGKRRKASAESPQETRNESGQMSASHADKVRNREEKNREEEEIQGESAQRAPRAASASPNPRGSRLPAGWTPEPEHMAFAEGLGLRNGRASAELEKFRDYWASQPGQKGVKTDWPATWRNWVRRSVEDTAGKGSAASPSAFAGVL